MNVRIWSCVLFLAAVFAFGGLSDAAEAEKESADKAAVFGLTKIWTFHLQISAENWKAMEPKRPEGTPGGPGQGGPPRGGFPGMFGQDFPYVEAAIEIDGTTYKRIGVRFKGNATYGMSANSLKRPFRIDFNRYDKDQQFHGLKQVNLSNNVMDPTRLRECLSYAVFREAGVPASRTAFVRLFVTVPGIYDKELAGVYTLVELVDKSFLKDRFQSSRGLLLKPEGVRALEYLGDEWGEYERRYQPKTKADAENKQRLIEFVKLVQKGDDAQFRREIASYLDVDQFLRFVAANCLLANQDSFLGMIHNYYLYLDPTTAKFVFLPWDLDLSFGVFGMSGPQSQLVDLSISHPHSGQNRLIERILAIPEYDEAYRKHLGQIIVSYFNADRLGKDIATGEAALKQSIEEETKAVEARKESGGRFGRGPGGMFGVSLSLADFVVKRVESVDAQLAGKSKGYTPAGGGPGGGPGGFGRFMAQPILDAIDGNKDGKLSKEELVEGARTLFARVDKEKKGLLDEKGLADGLSSLLPRPPEFGGPPPGEGRRAGGRPGPAGDRPAPGGERPAGDRPGPGGDRPGGMFGFGSGPGAFWAGAVVKRADADQDGKVMLAELVTATESLFTQSDKNKDNSLDVDELAAGLLGLFPMPRGFGPPGMPPGPPGPPPSDANRDREGRP